MHYDIENKSSIYHTFTQLVVPGATFVFFAVLSLLLYRRRSGDRSAELLILFFLLVGITYFAGYASSRSDLIGRIAMGCVLPLIPLVFIHFLQVYLKRFDVLVLSTTVIKIYYGLVILLSLFSTSSLMVYSWDRSLYSFIRLIIIGFFVFGIFTAYLSCYIYTLLIEAQRLNRCLKLCLPDKSLRLHRLFSSQLHPLLLGST